LALILQTSSIYGIILRREIKFYTQTEQEMKSVSESKINNAFHSEFVPLKQYCIRRKQSSGMWHRVEVVLTDVSEESIASIFRVEGKYENPHAKRPSETFFNVLTFLLPSKIR
jgi:hypothetical protein